MIRKDPSEHDLPTPVEYIECDGCGEFFPPEQINAETLELCADCYIAEDHRQAQKEKDFELGADYGRVNGWYSDTFGDSFSDPYDY